METVTQDEKETVVEVKKTGMQKFWSGFYDFMAMGGFLVFLIAFIVVAVLISYLRK